MYLTDDMEPSRILHTIENDPLGKSKDYTYIILGDGPRTGKTWLREALQRKGFNACEISEEIRGLVTYQDKRNHCKIVEYPCKQVVIVLNKNLREII